MLLNDLREIYNHLNFALGKYDPVQNKFIPFKRYFLLLRTKKIVSVTG